MAVGIPTIATAIGPNFKMITDGENGFLVNSDDEWVKKIILLIENKTLRETMGANARKYAVSNLSTRANNEQYLNVLNRCTL
jgi:glycosyltransferase involved in cell wall biosynthesis